ncbi:hypothetical protein [Rhodococcus artemisiae]|uniref:Uncharacterized protein n=1 Tax=Rhodococcus artemisiae TaxID=714159 RepID=A0ABU7L538_9NOCA|nr:hypothetical protein [Rhodococcus artemisiae]MEE2056660.1 hypothetical protein [Rhodococcus artemisiae]
MKRGALLLVVLIAAAVAAFFIAWDGPKDPPQRTLDDSAFVLDGHSTTCTALFRKPCDYETQLEYNRRGTELDTFVDSTDLGPWGNSLPFADAAELALQACVYSRTAGMTVLEFIELGQRTHPDAGSVELTPFWNKARQELCATPWQ